MELINELQQGIRLPQPYCCPAPIADIINRCFEEIPSERPSFSEIRCSIQLGHNKLRAVSNTSLETVSTTNTELDYADLQFGEMYLDMRRRNCQYQKQNEKPTIETKQFCLESVSMTPRVGIETGQHHTSEEMILPNTSIRFSELECKSISQEYQICTIDEKAAPKYQLISPGVIDQKRPVSFSGVDPTSLLQTEVTSRQLVPSKSYPCYQNPSYMMLMTEL